MPFLKRRFQMFLMNKELKIKILNDASLKDFCTFKIGGSAKHVFIVESAYSLVQICRQCKMQGIKFKVIGLGANLLFSDAGYNGGIIVNRTKTIKIMNTSVLADSGVNVTTLIQKCITKNLGGIEKLNGIPSTVGGAVVNSLGAFDTNFTDFVEYVLCYDPENDRIFKLKANDCEFSYRDSIFKRTNVVILQVKLKLYKTDCKVLQENAINAVQRKKLTQPLNTANAGSVFKRGNIIPAQIIDQLGLKGLRVGDAQISNKHAGFIVNLGSATAQDVKNLINEVKTRVYNHIGEELETEIEFVK